MEWFWSLYKVHPKIKNLYILRFRSENLIFLHDKQEYEEENKCETNYTLKNLCRPALINISIDKHQQ